MVAPTSAAENMMAALINVSSLWGGLYFQAVSALFYSERDSLS
jgi:hypothetical protein